MSASFFTLMPMVVILSRPEIFCSVFRGTKMVPSSWVPVRSRMPTTFSCTFFSGTEKNVQLKVVGILERTGTQDDGTIFVPLKTLQKISGLDKITTIGIKVKKDADITKLETALYQLPDMQVVSFSQVKQTILKLIATARVMVLSIAVIALLIAMVGVVNTILMSVLERKHEIGILKTMGAMPGDIFRLVWTETLILCACGGLAGLGLALAFARLSALLLVP